MASPLTVKFASRPVARAIARACRHLPWLLACLVVTACSPSEATVLVDLRTDLSALEMDLVRVQLLLGEDAVRTTEFAPQGDEDFIAGTRVAEWSLVPTGSYVLQVEAIRNGQPVGRQRLLAEIRDDRLLAILLQRSCRDVECPSADAPSCLGGMCVPSECVVNDGCEDEAECVVDTDCPSTGCGTGSCAAGACFLAIDATLCPNGAYCDMEAECSDPSDGLVLHYEMEGDISTQLVPTVGSATLECAGPDCGGSVEGRVGSALQVEQCFQGAAPELAAVTEAMTVALFVQPSQLDTFAMAVSKPFGDGELNSFSMYVFPRGEDPTTLTFALADRTLAAQARAPLAVPAGTWIHAVGRYQDDTFELFIDGVSVATTERTEPLRWDTGELAIGCDINAGVQEAPWLGRLDDVRIYGRALSDREITALAAQ